MDYFQGVVTEYLRADRATFVNTELFIQIEQGDMPAKGNSWYCDAAAVNFRESTLYLCEVTYSKTMQALANRLLAWQANWEDIRAAVSRDCGVPEAWQVCPWVFVPRDYHDQLKQKAQAIWLETPEHNSMPSPRVTYLESVLPWNYKTWDRRAADLED
ncbi:MAG: hypothetical protein AAFX56_19195 [Pseudomonadota bacterium]